MPRIGRETENEELCQILSGKEDSFLTIFKITRALCNYTNDILDDNKIASKILGLGYKEDIEENRQMIQTLLNVNVLELFETCKYIMNFKNQIKSLKEDIYDIKTRIDEELTFDFVKSEDSNHRK